MLEIRYKSLIKSYMFKAAAALVYFSGCYFLLDRLLPKKVLYILFYHRLVEKKDGGIIPEASVEKKRFEKQIKYLTYKYKVVSMHEAAFLNACKEGKDLVSVTFDDGYRDNYTLGYEIFKKYELRPTIYITAGCVEEGENLWTDRLRNITYLARLKNIRLSYPGLTKDFKCRSFRQRKKLLEVLKEYIKTLNEEEKRSVLKEISEALGVDPKNMEGLMLNWDMVIRLKEIGVDIGSHTMTHPILSRNADDVKEFEIGYSKELIEKRIGSFVTGFAYPNGQKEDYDEFSKTETARHYRTAVTTVQGVNFPGDDPYELKRICVSYNMNLTDLKVKLLYCKVRGIIEKSITKSRWYVEKKCSHGGGLCS